MRGVFVTGTDTGVGKTVVSAALAWALKKKGFDVGVMKPFATGSEIYSDHFKSQDVAILAEAAGVKETDDELNPSFYNVPASPMMAATLTKHPFPDVGNVLKTLKNLSLKHEFLIVEGIGGILVPITPTLVLAQFAKSVGLPIIIVTRPSLGTLNHTLLTVNACRKHNLGIGGLVVNMMPKRPTTVEEATPAVLGRITGLEVLGVIPKLKDPGYLSVGRAIKKWISLHRLVAME
jgi:dethiobiotin synthetase